MGKSVINAIVVALALLLMPSLAVATGLGKLTVLSGLGQPLKAEIELVSVQKGESGNLSVRLPPAEVFRQANIDYSGSLMSIKFGIEQRGVDRYVIVVSTTQPISEPFLDLLVELDWAGGRLVREYTFLLDPLEYKGPQPEAALAAPAAAAPVATPVEAPKQPEAGAKESPAAAAPPALSPAPTPKVARSYEVKRGDTLSKIAIANKLDGVSLQQMLIALYRSNADAFIGNNINRLRAGRILNLPERDAAASVDQADATRAVIAQAEEFNEYRRKLGAAAPERPDTGRQSARGKITAKVEDKPAAIKKEVKDQLRLSKTEEPGKPGAKRSAQSLREDSLAKEKALKESNERIALLDKNAQDMKKLLEVKSQAGAQLQQQAAKAVADNVAEPAKTQEAAKADTPAPASEAAKAASEPAKAVEAPKADEPAKAQPPKAVPKAAPPPPPEPSLMDEILGNELALYGGGGCLLLLFGGYGYYAWKRKKSQQKIASSELGGLGGPSLAEDAVFGDAGGAKNAGASEVQSDFGQSGAPAVMDSEEVDPIAEADVYMAYGRDTQAEEILKEALAKDTRRQPVRVKLLEIYAGRKDAKMFEAVAAELHAGTGGEGAEWAKAVAMGLQFDPSNPLYGGTGSAGASPAHSDTQVLSTADLAAITVVVPEVALVSAGNQAETTGLDFDLNTGGNEGKPTPAAHGTDSEATVFAGSRSLGALDTATTSIDFNFELPAEGGGRNAMQAPKVGGADVDFDFNLELPATKEQAPAAPLDLSSISLDLGAPGGASAHPDAHWQEVATKLDLAKAYQEMGDKDGARELLNEVRKEGDAAQQKQAQTMLSALG